MTRELLSCQTRYLLSVKIGLQTKIFKMDPKINFNLKKQEFFPQYCRIQKLIQIEQKLYKNWRPVSPKKCMSSTHNHKVVAPVALAALGAAPVLVPDVRTVRHVLPPGLLAHILRGAPLRHVELLQRPQRKVRLTAPPDLRQAGVLTLRAGLDRIQALFRVSRLVRTHVALERGTCSDWNRLLILKQV